MKLFFILMLALSTFAHAQIKTTSAGVGSGNRVSEIMALEPKYPEATRMDIKVTNHFNEALIECYGIRAGSNLTDVYIILQNRESLKKLDAGADGKDCGQGFLPCLEKNEDFEKDLQLFLSSKDLKKYLSERYKMDNADSKKFLKFYKNFLKESKSK